MAAKDPLGLRRRLRFSHAVLRLPRLPVPHAGSALRGVAHLDDDRRGRPFGNRTAPGHVVSVSEPRDGRPLGDRGAAVVRGVVHAEDVEIGVVAVKNGEKGGIAMSQTVQQLLDAALSLPDEEQLQLVAALTAAVDEGGLRPFDDTWLAEVQRRSAEFDAGGVELIPWAEVKKQVRHEVMNRV